MVVEFVLVIYSRSVLELWLVARFCLPAGNTNQTCQTQFLPSGELQAGRSSERTGNRLEGTDLGNRDPEFHDSHSLRCQRPPPTVSGSFPKFTCLREHRSRRLFSCPAGVRPSCAGEIPTLCEFADTERTGTCFPGRCAETGRLCGVTNLHFI